MSFLRVLLFTLMYYLLPHLRFCKAYQNCLVALIKITNVYCRRMKCDFRLPALDIASEADVDIYEMFIHFRSLK